MRLLIQSEAVGDENIEVYPNHIAKSSWFWRRPPITIFVFYPFSSKLRDEFL
jgi:hypothetical protein